MDTYLNESDLKYLMEKEDEFCISIYSKSFSSGNETEQNRIHLKNSVRNVLHILRDKGLKEALIQKILKPAFDLIQNEPFWQNCKQGLALFLSFAEFRYFHLPIDVEDTFYIGNKYYIKPLIPYFMNKEIFYVLTISQKQVHLNLCSRYFMKRVEIEELPPNIFEVLNFDRYQKQYQLQQRFSSGGASSAVYHGHGYRRDEDEHKQNVQYFIQKVDGVLQKVLNKETSPLVLAGVDYLMAFYREISRYPHLLNQGVQGNPEFFDEKELHKKAWKIVEPVFAEKQNQALEHFYDLESTARVSKDLKEIVFSAYRGKIDTLFVVEGEEKWGGFDASTGTVAISEEKKEGDIDLVEYALYQTLSHNGTVYVLSYGKVPGKEGIAAIYRY